MKKLFLSALLVTVSLASALTIGSASTDFVAMSSQYQCSDNIHNLDFVKCPAKLMTSFMDYHNQLSCLGIVKAEPTCDSAECEAYAPRADVMGIATRIRNIPMKKEYKCEKIYTDVTAKTLPSWTCQIVERGVQSGLMDNYDTTFGPRSAVTRSEVYSTLMRSICIRPESEFVADFYDFTPAQLWNKKVYQAAYARGLIDVSERKFQPYQPVRMQEVYAIAARVTEWTRNHPTCPPYIPENACVSQE